MKVRKICLHCGRPNDNINYTCRCKSTEWSDEYRSLDVELQFSEEEEQLVRESFQNYSFDHPAGMLQYAALPFRNYHPPAIDAVGATPLIPLKHFSADSGCHVFIKNEGDNPSGCFKDRETMVCLLNSLRRGLRRAVIYSSGNAAASAAIFAQKIDFELITFVAGDTYPEKIDFIRQHGSDVMVIGDENTNFETGFRLFAEINAQGVFSDRGFDNWSVRNPYRVQGDKTTALEIVKQLTELENARVPDYVIVPTANGSCLAGVWKGFKELKEMGLIDKLPKMVSAGIKDANPVFQAVHKRQTQYPEVCDLSQVDEDDAKIGSIILAEEGYDSIEAAKAVLESGGLALEVQRTDIQESLQKLLDEEREVAIASAILPEPASVITLAAVKQLKRQVEIDHSQNVVALLSGHGLKAHDKLEALLSNREDLMDVVDKIIQYKFDEVTPPSETVGQRVEVEADSKAIIETFEKHITEKLSHFGV